MTGGRFCCCLVSCGLFHAKSDFPPMGGITTFAYFCSSLSSSFIFPTFLTKKNMGKVIFSKDAPRKNNLFFSTPKTIPATFLLFNGTGHLLILLGQYQLVGSRYCATVQGWLYFFYMMMKNSRFSVSTGIKKLHSVLKN